MKILLREKGQRKVKHPLQNVSKEASLMVDLRNVGRECQGSNLKVSIVMIARSHRRRILPCFNLIWKGVRWVGHHTMVAMWTMLNEIVMAVIRR